MLRRLLLGDMHGVFVAYPTGVHAVHVNTRRLIVRRRCAGHHVQRRLGHIRMRVTRGFEAPVELPFHGRNIHDVFVPVRRTQHERLETGVQHERCDGVHQLRFKKFNRRHFVEQQPPRIAVPQVHLLEVGIETSLGEQMRLHHRSPISQVKLRKLGCLRESQMAVGSPGAVGSHGHRQHFTLS